VSDRDHGAAELRLASESIEALATRLAELIGNPAGEPESAASDKEAMLSASEVSKMWGVSRRWVYNHAEALGARRLGSGPRPRLRFDADEVAERLGAPRCPATAGDGRRLTAIAGIPHSDSLSATHRANVAESQIATAGGRCNAPGPASKEVLRRDLKPSPAGLAPPPSRSGRRGGDW